MADEEEGKEVLDLSIYDDKQNRKKRNKTEERKNMSYQGQSRFHGGFGGKGGK